jgi:hypothetical protein
MECGIYCSIKCLMFLAELKKNYFCRLKYLILQHRYICDNDRCLTALLFNLFYSIKIIKLL